MRRLASSIAIALACALAGVLAASAAVDVRLAVQPDSVQQGGQVKIFFALANTGHEPTVAGVCFELGSAGGTLFGPLCGRMPLAAGESRVREFAVHLAVDTPIGDYVLTVRATGADGQTDEAVALLTVTPSSGPCCGEDPPPPIIIGESIWAGLGIGPSPSPPSQPSSWGRIKGLYR